MSAGSAVAALRGEPVVAFAGMWLPHSVLRAVVAEDRVERLPDALAAAAQALSLDMMLVPAEEPWATDAVHCLRSAGIGSLWAVSGMLGRVAEREGWEATLRSTASAPGGLAFGLDEALHEALVSTRLGRSAGADALLVADDLAGSSGWLVSPDFALEVLVPNYGRIVREWGSERPAVFHSDGDVRVIMPAIRRHGFGAMHFASLGPEELRTSFRAARELGLCPMGGLDLASLRSAGPAAGGIDAVTLAAGGPAVLADDGGMTTPEDVTNLAAAVQAALEVMHAG